ncbi:MAG TPA: hypothetical protein VMW29_02670 [Candidatus Bathyarchaeia archaeon]|nr:hypothetical protein [Candidatus Bathyarchaeia archaeon]
MNSQLDLNSVQESCGKARNILVLIPTNPNLDKIATSLALFLSFKKQEKQVMVACPSSMTVAFNRLVGVDKIAQKIGNRNLIISFDYQKDSIEKVSYNIEDKKFNLVVEPRAGYPALDPNKVSYSYAGTDADLIFVVGALRLEDLGNFYLNEKKTFDKATIVNLDIQNNNTKFGQINLVDSQFTSLSELVALVLQGLNFSVDQDIVTNILAGIEANTSNLQSPNTSASAFETVAWCLKNGAKRGSAQIENPMTGLQPPFVSPQGAPLAPAPIFKPRNEVDQVRKAPEAPAKQPPPDWFKPKIFKGSTTV